MGSSHRHGPDSPLPPAPVDLANLDGDTPLMWAVLRCPEAIDTLLAHQGADPETRNKGGWPVSVLAAYDGYMDILRLLYKREPFVIFQDGPGHWNALTEAAGNDTAALVALLDKGGPPDERDARGRTPLICAIKADRTDTIRALLARHADPKKVTAANCSPLDFAVVEHFNDIALLLIGAGADVNRCRFSGNETRSFTPLLLAANHRYPDTAAILLDHGARIDDMNDDGDTALMEASRQPSFEIIRVLVERGANVNARRDSGLNALILAAYNGCADGVRLLLEHGADLHATAVEGGPRFGALEAAAKQGRPYVLEVLADAGAAVIRGRLLFRA